MKLGINQQKWVEALRSGDFKQTQGVLKDERGHCCLGVACEIFKDELKITEEEHLRDGIIFNKTSKVLPSVLRNHLGLRHNNGSALNSKFSLAKMNDAGSTFHEIADVIEKQFTLLFKESK